MFKLLMYVAVSVGLVGVLLVVGGLIANRLPLSVPPGLRDRLFTYMTTNVAETTEHNILPELRLRSYAMNADALYGLVAEAIDALGWKVLSVSPRTKTINAMVVTRLWRFKDDVVIRVQPRPDGKSAVYVRSSSRVGKGDLGANARHVIDLYQWLDMKVPEPGSQQR